MSQVALTARTEGLQLFRLQDLRVLRVGSGGRREEAWWRYGQQFRVRRLVRGPVMVGLVVGATTLGVASGVGPISMLVGYFAVGLGPVAFELSRVASFGRTAWRGQLTCQKCGALRESLTFQEFKRLELVLGGPYGTVALRIPCRDCDRWSLRLRDLEAQHLIQRALAHRHFFGASKKRVEKAFDLIDTAGSATEYLMSLGRERRRFRDYDEAELVALEMAVSDVAEAKMKEMSLDEQRETWQREEELARIIDRELTPL